MMAESTDRPEPFAPADGVQARWRYAYELVESKKPGDAITLMELAEALGIEYDAADRDQRRLLFSVMDKAREHLEADYLHTVKTVEGFGWVVPDAVGALRQAESRTRKVFSAVKRTVRAFKAVPREELPASERRGYDFGLANANRMGEIAGRPKRDTHALERESKQRKEIEGR